MTMVTIAVVSVPSPGVENKHNDERSATEDATTMQQGGNLSFAPMISFAMVTEN
jgi:hypothetical protein